MISSGRTERLILRPVQLDDADQIQQLFPHWEIVKFMLNRVPWPYPSDGALRFLTDVAIPQNQNGEAWNWTIRLLHDPDQIIGSINLRQGEGTHRGFWLGLPWHGQGFMSEACVWVNDFWFDALAFPLLRVAKAVDNTSSSRISKRQGMRVVSVDERDFVSGRLPSEVWEITAEEWHAWKARNALGTRCEK
jgi:ribosomal-protein-alanine N-acetyltransferase